VQVYVDESGDSGMQGKPGSSLYFVVAAVLFDSDESAKRCRAAIRGLHESLGWSSRQEFKFNRANKEIRSQFFNAVRDHDFWFNAVVLNKKSLTGPGFQFKDPFYKYTVRLVFTNAKSYLEAATVVMDQCGSRDFRQQMEKYLKAQMTGKDGACPIKSVRTEKSHACELVQMADMVAGAVARSFNPDKSDAKMYRAIIRHRERNVQLWPV
jgi:hypothetical protein